MGFFFKFFYFSNFSILFYTLKSSVTQEPGENLKLSVTQEPDENLKSSVTQEPGENFIIIGHTRTRWSFILREYDSV